MRISDWSSDVCSSDLTGPQGGSWYPLGGAIKNVVEQNMSGTTMQILPGAGIANVKALESGKADLGFANSVSTVDAINGKPPFTEKAKTVCNIARLYPPIGTTSSREREYNEWTYL